jgi:GNAT superfamily N-acetyltransferase
MSQITVRQATLADAASITALQLARIETWTRRDLDGEPVATPYTDLTLFERWLVGGPWASVEMCAVHLANLLRGIDGIPLVAECEGQVGAVAEVFIGREPEPFGHHINLSWLAVHPEFVEVGLGSALLTYIHQMAQAIRCQRVTVADGADHADLLEHHGYQRAHMGRPVTFPAQAGRVFYRAQPLKDTDPALITGWHMPLGRTQNARRAWDRVPPGLWNSVPQIVEPESARLHITVTGQEAFALMQQDRYQPERVHVYCWSKRPLNSLLLMALRDWAARHDYETLLAFVWDFVLPSMEIETASAGPAQYLYARGV